MPIASTPSVYRFKLHTQRISITAPFSPPVTVTITHDGGVVRQNTIQDCRQRNAGLNWREF